MSSIPLHLTGRRTSWQSSNIDCIIPDSLYLGSLASALSPESLKNLGITHIVSVCPDYPSTGPTHLNVCVKDRENEDLLVHMGQTCRFIQEAINGGGTAFVHCVYGVSRSATMVSAYLMMTRQISPSAAIKVVKACRPGIDPNAGFVRQLAVFAECAYDPSPSHPVYIAWKARQTLLASFSSEGKNAQSMILDPVEVLKDAIYITTELPSSPDDTETFLSSLRTTHLFTVAPSRVDVSSAPPDNAIHRHFSAASGSLSQNSPKASLLHDTTLAIQKALATDSHARVLLYSTSEEKLALVCCAFIMTSQSLQVDDVMTMLLEAFPLFISTRGFYTQLQEYAGSFELLDHTTSSALPTTVDNDTWGDRVRKMFGQ